jgi:type II secretory pathway component PulF
MPTYKYEALDSKGVEKVDLIEAETENEACDKVRARNMFPTKITSHDCYPLPEKVPEAPEKGSKQMSRTIFMIGAILFWMATGGFSIAAAFKSDVAMAPYIVGAAWSLITTIGILNNAPEAKK